ncbi:MAG: hypothetical protein R3B70_26045 [Polyangiaceae bacterium]
MQELTVKFTPASGDPPRNITLRIGDPVRKAQSWAARVEILGFDEPHDATTQGEDWAQVLELAAMVLPYALESMVSAAGGGTLEPSFYERPPRDLSSVPPEIRAVLGLPDPAGS